MNSLQGGKTKEGGKCQRREARQDGRTNRKDARHCNNNQYAAVNKGAHSPRQGATITSPQKGPCRALRRSGQGGREVGGGRVTGVGSFAVRRLNDV